MKHEVRIAIDIGGTFTDVVLDAGGRRTTTKVLTTYGDPADAVLAGIDQVLETTGITAAEVGLVLHGTTLATNALIERRGAVTALLTTAGHRDVLEMALENRFEQYDLGIERPEPLVPRVLRFGIPERLDAAGNVLLPLDRGSVEALVPELVARGVTSVAIGFLHAYANPAHEREVAQILAAALPGLSITLASDVCPEIREYERISTACANAFVKPLMGRYLASLSRQLAERGLASPVLLMTSGGGLTDLATAAAYPIRLVESGPAGGAILAADLARSAGFDRVISFDMGGTTAKICLIDHAEPLLSRSFEVGRVYRFKKGSGIPVRIPVIEMVEIGAGGGSVARVDRLRRIQVGPDSAGSEPGPACYGLGGTAATVTDADLLLGRIQPELFAGGTLTPDPTAAAAAVRRAVGAPLGLADDLAAWGITAVVDENMAAAARAHATEWGADTASRTLVAFGGAGPLHAAALADKLKVDRILVPAGAGVGSAVGFLLAPISFEVVRSRYQRLSAFAAEAVRAVFDEMRAEALGVVGQAAPGADWREVSRASMRYVGQGYEISVAISGGPNDPALGTRLLAAFEAEYRRLYGRLIPGLDVEVLSWTLAISAVEGELAAERPGGRAAPERARAADPPAVAPIAGVGQLYDAAGGCYREVNLYRREMLEPGMSLAGPALVAEPQTTTVVPAEFSVRVLAAGHLLLERDGRAAG